MIAVFFRTALLVLLANVLSACSTAVEGDEPAELFAELNSQRVLWDQSNISNYTLRYTEFCDCEINPISVSVVNDEVVAAQVFDQSGMLLEDINALDFDDVLTVDGFFTKIRNLIGDDNRLVVEYSETFGYPMTIRTNRDLGDSDSEFTYTIELQAM